MAFTANKISTMDIANRTGLSRSTVLNILNNTAGLKYSEQTKKRVHKAAEEVGYQISSLRKAIKRPLKHIAFVLSNPDNIEFSYVGEIWRGVRHAAMEQGYQLMFCESDWTPGNESDADAKTLKMIELVNGRIIDGLIIDKSLFGAPQMKLLQDANVPFMCINGRKPVPEAQLAEMPELQETYEIDLKAHWVYIDHESGGYIATRHLIDNGHRRIAMINPEMSHYPLHYLPGLIGFRIEGYKKALLEAGIEIDRELLVEGALTERSAICAAIDKLLAMKNRPTALFAADDAIAVFAITHLQSRGIRIPHDISVIGYGNWSVSSVCSPQLTTIDVPWAQMGQIGTEMLISLLNSEAVDFVKTLNVKLLQGQSVRNINEKI
jgi:DNA-binding LacI/PurR family transcriptional regulator